MQEFEKMMDFLQTRFLSLEIITANKKENAQLNKVETISNLNHANVAKILIQFTNALTFKPNHQKTDGDS